MSLRARLTLAAAAAVAVAVLMVAVVSYFIVERRLVDQVDKGLEQQSGAISCPTVDTVITRRIAPPIPDQRQLQIVLEDGSKFRTASELPVSAADRGLFNNPGGTVVRNVSADGRHLRMITREVDCTDQLGVRAIVQLAQPLRDVDDTMASLRWILAIVAGSGILLAAGAGLLVSRAALRPVEKLTRAAEHVARTQDLAASIDVTSSDEIGRLASSFNEMLTALDDSRQQQRQLVADASHELRTPLTSLRTNIEVLESRPEMPPVQRQQLLSDVVTQLDELGVLVGDLVELARDQGVPQPEELSEVRFDELVEGAVTRARLHAPRVDVAVTQTEPTVVDAQQGLLERAVRNILDNACKWSPPGGTVEVTLIDGVLRVRDHGPGIDAADLPHVFDRFYRSPDARSMPGSGLGLAIVKHAAEAHGGSVVAEAAPDGGTIITLRLPTAEAIGAVSDLVEL